MRIAVLLMSQLTTLNFQTLKAGSSLWNRLLKATKMSKVALQIQQVRESSLLLIEMPVFTAPNS